MREVPTAEKEEKIKGIKNLRQKLTKLLSDCESYDLTKEEIRREVKYLITNYSGEELLWVDRMLTQVLDGQVPLRECIIQIEKLEFMMEGYKV